MIRRIPRALALRVLEEETDVPALMVRMDGQHVGMHGELPVLDSDESVDEPDQLLALESADQHSPHLLHGSQMAARHNVQVREPPHLLLQLLHSPQLLHARQIPNRERHRRLPHAFGCVRS